MLLDLASIFQITYSILLNLASIVLQAYNTITDLASILLNLTIILLKLMCNLKYSHQILQDYATIILQSKQNLNKDPLP